MDDFFSFSFDFSEESAWRYIVNIVATFILVRFIHYRNYKRTDVLLTFFAFNTIIFFLAYFLKQIELSVGSAVGLFAVFSILRYRTESLVTKDMTYLFICVSLGIFCAISNCNLPEMIILCFIILLIPFLMENTGLFKNEISKIITWDNIQLIKPSEKEQLLQQLRSSTGLNITRFEIIDIDFVKDSATIMVYYVKEV